MKVIIDRFEGKFAICEKEDRKMIRIEKTKIPSEVQEGDVLNITENNIIVIDKEETMRRKKKIEDLTNELWN